MTELRKKYSAFVPEIKPLKHDYVFLDDTDSEGNLLISHSDTDQPILEDLEEHGLHAYVTIDSDVKIPSHLYIHFDKISGLEVLNNEDGRYDRLFIQKMDDRAYRKILPQIALDMNFLFNEDPAIAYDYLRLKKKIIFKASDGSDEEYTPEEFHADLSSMIYSSRFRNVIMSIDEGTYSLTLDQEVKPQSVEDLQVTDAANKAILECAYTFRVITPLITEYLSTTTLKGREKENFYYRIFRRLFVIYGEPHGVEMLSKLRKIVQPRITRTLYPNRFIWNYFRYAGIDPELVIADTTKSTLRQILSKITLNRKTISFLDVVIRTKIKYKFRAKLKYNYKSVQINDPSDDDMDNIDRQSLIWQHKTDDILLMSNDISIKDFLQKNIKKYGITQEQMEEVHKKIRITEFQKMLMNNYYHSKFTIPAFDGYRATLLLMVMVYQLKETNQYSILPDLLLSFKKPGNKRRTLSARISQSVLTSKTVSDTLDDYKWTENIFLKNNPLLDIVSISGYDFESYDGHDVKITSKELLVEEYARFIYECNR